MIHVHYYSKPNNAQKLVCVKQKFVLRVFVSTRFYCSYANPGSIELYTMCAYTSWGGTGITHRTDWIELSLYWYTGGGDWSGRAKAHGYTVAEEIFTNVCL